MELRFTYAAEEHRHILSNKEFTLVNRNQSLTMVLVLTKVEYTCLYSLHKIFTLMIKTIVLSLILFDSWTKEKVFDFIMCIFFMSIMTMPIFK
jgi:hypothetical protein